MRIPQGIIEKNRCSRIRQFLISRKVLRSRDHYQLVLAPITTLPSSFPRDLFDDGMQNTATFHKMIDSMTTDVEGLLKIYENIRQEDEFVNSFCEIVERVYIDGDKDLRESLRAYVTRNDFLVNMESPEVMNVCTATAKNMPLSLKQVEINLSSVVGPHTMQELSELHRNMVIPEYRSKLPQNRPRDGLVENLCLIDEIYKAKYGDGQRQCILWVTALFESNFAEILSCVECLKAEIEKCSNNKDSISSPDATVISTNRRGTGDSASAYSPRSCSDSCEHTRVFVVAWDNLATNLSALKFENQRFYFNPADFIYNEDSYPYEISTIYFRTGYSPEHYQTQNHWRLREYIEACKCAVIPSAVSQLVGLKKAQQVWSKPEFLESFEGGAYKQLGKFFVQQVDLNDVDQRTLDMVADAKKHPENYVLKPQREGGGNNTYGDEIPPALDKYTSRLGKNSHILMEKIRSPQNPTEIFVDDVMSVESCVSEIGFYGVACYSGPHQVINEPIGYLLRTKRAESNEGGICVNAAVFDSVMLV